jgi:hypothetical protein
MATFPYLFEVLVHVQHVEQPVKYIDEGDVDIGNELLDGSYHSLCGICCHEFFVQIFVRFGGKIFFKGNSG